MSTKCKSETRGNSFRRCWLRVVKRPTIPPLPQSNILLMAALIIMLMASNKCIERWSYKINRNVLCLDFHVAACGWRCLDRASTPHACMPHGCNCTQRKYTRAQRDVALRWRCIFRVVLEYLLFFFVAEASVELMPCTQYAHLKTNTQAL